MPRYLSLFAMSVMAIVLPACKVRVEVPAGGSVNSASGNYDCPANSVCVIDVVDLFFDETFTAVPEEGYVFAEWKKRDRGFFGHTTDSSVRLYTSDLETIPALAAFLETDDVFYLEPSFQLMPDFTATDDWLKNFVANKELYPGGSVVIVDKMQGVIHKSAFGDQDEETLALVASVSKMPAVTLLMALHEDDKNLEFDIQSPITTYLPWQGVWDSDITTEHLVSHRSGLPGLRFVFSQIDDYLPHICQFLPEGTLLECGETLFTTSLPNLPSSPANTAADYGGSQWQLSGAVAEIVGGASWNQLWDQYIAEPCGLESSRFGNHSTNPAEWDGNSDSLAGLDNPAIGSGMATNLDDFAKLLSLHLNDGACGDIQVLSPESVAFMKEQRTPTGEVVGAYPLWGYGMGWWFNPAEGDGDRYLYINAGIYGSISWIDVERNYGGFVIFENYQAAETDSGVTGILGVFSELIPIIEEALDEVR